MLFSILSTGIGYSGHWIWLKVFVKMSMVLKIPYTIKDRRHGDVATCYADAKVKHKMIFLGWKAEKSSRCDADSWRWQSSI